MSTTVTYKGSTLTTAENQTRVLKTAGKYMEDDVTIVDVTSGGAGPSIWQDQDGFLVLDEDGAADGDLMGFGTSINDLTGTTWLFSSSVDKSSPFSYFVNLNFIPPDMEPISVSAIRVINGEVQIYIYNSLFITVSIEDQTLEFISGTDIADPDLIAWVTANATQQS